jgi:hypothetical protein
MMKSSDKPYDNAANLLVRTGAASLCRWLGHMVDMARPLSTTMPTTTIHPDSCFEIGHQEALHIEFQRRGERNVRHRVLEYDARMRLQPELVSFSIRHEVVVLGEGHVHNEITDVGLRFTFPVRYVREEDHEELLQDPILAPFAAIADVDDKWRPDVLLVAARIESSTIDQVWKELPMPIPTSEQYRYEEGLTEGEARAIAEALQDRFGDDTRLPEIARHLAAQGTGWFKRVMAAESLDDLL